jgi:hypothetical protein
MINNKAELLFARIYEDHPRLVGYFSEIALRSR